MKNIISKILKSLFVAVSLLAVMIFCACGKEERAVLSYEQPVATLTTAAQYGDTQSYISCFTPEAKAEYLAGEDYNSNLAETLLTRGDNGAELSYKLSDKTELDSAEMTALEGTYKKDYHKNVTIKKAFKFQATFTEKLEEKSLSDSIEMTVVKIDTNWYIFGGVIEKFDFK
ncbi:hypothetical protein [Ruminococcus sp.]|uniref:hypothetical protein n=1 Tax=Ruminococcus sp. TaxID=41978 RepID=UPI0025D39F57|nr:hypothetical protein [Ruminococcus sp.]